MRKALAHLKKSDPVLGSLITRIGPYRIEYAPADFSTLVRCIVAQQLSGKVAVTIYNRLAAAAGGCVTAEALLNLPPATMRSLGLSQPKIAYIRELAEACRQGRLDLPALESLPDEEVTRRLTQIKGIGAWTAHMYLIFALRRPDVLPTGDLGIRVAVQRVYGLEQQPTPAEVERIGRPWRPYASVASWYLWRSLGDGAGL
jgi:DNA-3-methyladenine glycosylase II